MDVYRIGVTIDMVNNASAVLGVIQRDVQGLHKSVEMLTSGFSAAKAAIAGVGAALSSGAALGARSEFVRQWGALQEQARDTLRTSPAPIAGTGAGVAMHSLIAANQAERLKVSENSGGAPEPFSRSDDTPAAQRNWAFDTKARWLMQLVPGEAIQNRSLELTKTVADASGLPQLNSAAPLAALVGADSSRSMRFSSDFLHAFKNGRIVAEDGPNAFADAILSNLMRSLKASNSNLFSSGASHLNSAFQDPSRHTRRNAQQSVDASTVELRANADILGSHATEQVVTRLATQHSPFEMDRLFNRSASAINADDTLAQNDPSARIKAFQSTWNNLLTALGAPLVDSGTKTMASLTHALNDLPQWIMAHPELVGAFEKTASAFAELAAAISLFAVGTTAATALSFLTGTAGLVGLAAGIERLGKALPSIPPLLAHLAGAATGANVGSQGVRAVGALGTGGRGLPSSASANYLHTRGSLVSDGVSSAWMPVGGSAVPPNTSSAAPNGPMPVYVVNGRDIADGTSAHQAALFSAPPIGPTGGDPRMNLPMPAFGSIVGL